MCRKDELETTPVTSEYKLYFKARLMNTNNRNSCLQPLPPEKKLNILVGLALTGRVHKQLLMFEMCKESLIRCLPSPLLSLALANIAHFCVAMSKSDRKIVSTETPRNKYKQSFGELLQSFN